ncbi:MAG: hypothetical protein K0R83_953, partial [Caulobacter sp.]|nr:hypothetical protein [Caulobacter sp.]
TGGAGRDFFNTADGFAPVLSGAIETDSILDLEANELIGLNLTSLSFKTVFDGTSNQAKLVYTASTGTTLFQLDVNGDNRVDYQLRLNGDQTANTYTTTDGNDANGGWYLYGGAA